MKCLKSRKQFLNFSDSREIKQKSRYRRMKKNLLGGLLIISLLGLSEPTLAGEEEKPAEGVRHQGIIFNIAKDRKIEKIGGIYEPEGLDKYVERRTDEVLRRMEKIESQLEETNHKLDQLAAQLVAQSELSAGADRSVT